jgi:hypothetical protein
VLIVGVVGGGLALGTLFTGDDSVEGPALDVEAEEFSANEVPLLDDGSRVTVEVLNGGGVPGVAGTVRDLLRDEGFDVVFSGNADSFDQATTVVIDRTSRGEGAEAIAHSLGASELRVEADSTLLVDVTVVIGADWTPESWQGVTGFVPSTGAGESERSWWDIRRFF